MTQDEPRQIIRSKSYHTSIGMKYLPAVARKLYHCRDLAEPQPYNFLTWFEFAHAEKTPKPISVSNPMAIKSNPWLAKSLLRDHD